MSTTLTVQITLYADGDIETDMDNALEEDELKEDFVQGAARDLRNEVAHYLKVPPRYVHVDATLLSYNP